MPSILRSAIGLAARRSARDRDATVADVKLPGHRRPERGVPQVGQMAKPWASQLVPDFDGKDGGLAMEFEPHLPDTSCTVRMRWRPKEA